MDTKRILKGVGIGCGAFVVWIIGLSIIAIIVFIVVFVIGVTEPSPTRERLTAHAGDNPEMVSIGNSYLWQIDFFRQNDKFVRYVFYDVTSDDIPELWICVGSTMYVYTYSKDQHKMVQLYESDMDGVSSGFYTDDKALIREYLGKVHSWVRYAYDEEQGCIVSTTLCEEKYNTKEKYTPQGIFLNEITSGTKSLKKALGLYYNDYEMEKYTL